MLYVLFRGLVDLTCPLDMVALLVPLQKSVFLDTVAQDVHAWNATVFLVLYIPLQIVGRYYLHDMQGATLFGNPDRKRTQTSTW